MAHERLFSGATVGALGLIAALFGACSSDDKPSSLVTGGAGSSPGGRSGASSAGSGADAGESTNGGGGGRDAGDTGEGGVSAMPRAQFPSELEADVGCNMVTPDANLVIRNTGDEPLVISSASADSGYVVKTTLPVEIAPGSAAILLVTPPAPSSDADAGALRTGKLSFTTNELGTPTHEVTLSTTVFEGSFEFTDSNGMPISNLKLSYGSDDACPDPAKYRVHNTGNVTFTVQGPTFPAHFAGTDLGASGQPIPPDGYAELSVGATSEPGATCSGVGNLSFTVMGAFCGSVPTLGVTWPVSTAPNAGSSCACTVPAP